jgi:predicted ATPase with chaperone activity
MLPAVPSRYVYFSTVMHRVSSTKIFRKAAVQVQRYRQRISGALLDRIHLHIEGPAVEYRDISSERAEEHSTAVRGRVGDARDQGALQTG